MTNKFYITDDVMRAMFWARAIELKTKGYRSRRPDDKHLYQGVRLGLINVWRPYGKGTEYWGLTPLGKSMFNELVKYEEENPRYSAEEGPSALLHRGTLFSWSHSAAIYEIENMRRLRQRTEEFKAKRAGRTGCAKTRCRAEPRPKMAICVDDCRDKQVVR